jgi:hypothetical protein
MPFLQCHESELFTVKYQYEIPRRPFSEVEAVRDAIIGVRVTAFPRGMQTIICMVVPHGTVAPLTLLRYLFRLDLEMGKEMISKWKWLGWSKNMGEAPVKAFAPALAQPLTFSLPAMQQPGGASQASIGGVPAQKSWR